MASGLLKRLKHAEGLRLFWSLLAIPAAAFLWLRTRAVTATCSVTMEGEGAAHQGPAVFVNWHRHLPYLIVHHGERRRWMLVSGAPYMATIARWCTQHGLRLARGASGEGAKAAVAELKAALARGESVSLAVDGPAGPRFHAKPGCVELARSGRVPLFPVAVDATRGRVVRGRWDLLGVVHPFAKIRVIYGAPIVIDEGVPDDVALARVEQGLEALERRLVGLARE